jgi:hypothetical protein
MFERWKKKHYYLGRIKVARVEVWQVEMKRAILMRAIKELETEKAHKEELRAIEMANKKTNMNDVEELTAQIERFTRDIEGWTDEQGNHTPSAMQQANQLSEMIIGLEQRILVMRDILVNRAIDGL